MQLDIQSGRKEVDDATTTTYLCVISLHQAHKFGPTKCLQTESINTPTSWMTITIKLFQIIEK